MPGIQFDGSVNLTTVGGFLATLIAIGAWVGHVESKIDGLGALVVSTAQMDKRLGRLEGLVTSNRGVLLDVQRKVGE